MKIFLRYRNRGQIKNIIPVSTDCGKTRNCKELLPFDVLKYMNQIDMGIFLCILELCLNKKNQGFDRTLFVEESVGNHKLLTAVYKMK